MALFIGVTLLLIFGNVEALERHRQVVYYTIVIDIS